MRPAAETKPNTTKWKLLNVIYSYSVKEDLKTSELL